MGKIFIHIGYPRTASTFIQDKILAKSDEVYFPGPPDNEKLYLEMCSNPNANFEKYRNMDKPVVFSCEDFSIGRFFACWDQDGLSDPMQNAENLHRHFPDATVLMVIRPQYDWIKSWWTFNVLRCTNHKHSTLNLAQIMETDFWRTKIYPYLRYNKMIEKYWSLFGKENVKIFFLKELSKNPDKFAKDFCGILGIKRPEIDFTKYNTSKSYLFTVLKMNLNRLYHLVRAEKTDRAYFNFTKRHLGRLDFFLRRVSGKGVNKRQLQKVRDIFKSDNDRLGKLLEVDVTEYGF